MRAKTKLMVGVVSIMAFAGAAAASPTPPFTIRWESETPGMQTTSATFTAGGQVETLDEQATGTNQTFTSSFGAGYSGTYKGAQILPADQYGGAGGTGNYAVALGNNATYTLDLSASTLPVTYFGYWLSALDVGNQVSFYGAGNKLLFRFTPQNVIASIDAQPDPGAYYGNPNPPYAGKDSGEPFVFVDFFASPGVTFDKIVFSEVNFGGGYESDNHTVGEWLTQGTGTLVPLPAPEPATWVLALVGFGLIGGALRRRTNAAAQSA